MEAEMRLAEMRKENKVARKGVEVNLPQLEVGRRTLNVSIDRARILMQKIINSNRVSSPSVMG
jgi:hypothetical protein